MDSADRRGIIHWLPPPVQTVWSRILIRPMNRKYSRTQTLLFASIETKVGVMSDAIKEAMNNEATIRKQT